MWVLSLLGKIPWNRKWQPTPVLSPGKSYGQRILVDYSSLGHKNQSWLSDWAHTHTHIQALQWRCFLFCELWPLVLKGKRGNGRYEKLPLLMEEGETQWLVLTNKLCVMLLRRKGRMWVEALTTGKSTGEMKSLATYRLMKP